MSTTKTLVAGTGYLVLVAALTLTGCAAGSSLGSSSTPGASTTTSTAPVAPPAVAPVVGAVLTSAQAKELTGSQKAYEMADKSLVLVQADQPLPPAVIAELTSKTDAIDGADAKAHPMASNEYGAIGEAAGLATGKYVFVVGRQIGSLAGEGPTAQQHEFWAVSNLKLAEMGAQTVSGKDDALAWVNGWIAGQPDAATYAVIVQN